MRWIAALFIILAMPVTVCGEPDVSHPSVETLPESSPLVSAARARVGTTLFYDPAYVGLDYPDGDVADDRGVCSDVVIRAFRSAHALDLQKAVHEDMRAAFSAYPDNWGLSRPDRNIDHRRVPNLETWFARQGWELTLSDNPDDYLPGDVVTFRLGNRLPHIGIVSHRKTTDGVPLLIHNIGAGTREEDVLFAYPMEQRFRRADNG